MSEEKLTLEEAEEDEYFEEQVVLEEEGPLDEAPVGELTEHPHLVPQPEMHQAKKKPSFLQQSLLALYSKSSEEAFRDFATETLKERECSQYIPKATRESDCGCGHSHDWHRAKGISESDAHSWNAAKHTRTQTTSAFGQLAFSGFGSGTADSNVSPFVRVDVDTNPTDIWNLLLRVWQLPPPKVVVSVTGGAKKFLIKNKLKNAFKKGLINIASTTDCWVISGGTNTGVMKYVGEALHECYLSSGQQRIVALGIAAWGVVDNHENLEASNGLFPYNYHLRDCHVNTDKKAILDHNHTHFLLSDNGTEGKYGVDIDLRARLEEHIRLQCPLCLVHGPKKHSSQCVTTPVVMIVVEGGPGTVTTCLRAVKNNIPIVIIKSSGRAADILASAYERSMNNDRSSKSELKELVREQNVCKNSEDIDSTVKAIEGILKYKNLITVFEPDENDCDELDKALLEGMLKAHKKDVECQIDLALIWNRADIAREHIFSQENRALWQNLCLDEVMHEALVHGRDDFVQLFLDNGLMLGEFLTVRRLRDLYHSILEDRSSTMAIIFEQIAQRNQTWARIMTLGCRKKMSQEEEYSKLLQTVGDCISSLMDNKMVDPYAHDRFVVLNRYEKVNQNAYDIAKILKTNVKSKKTKLDPIKAHHDGKHSGHSTHRRLQPDTDRSLNASHTSRQLKSKYIITADFEYPEKELFLWAILFNRQHLARLLWQMCPDSIGAALVAACLLKALAVEAGKQAEWDLARELDKESTFYEELACAVLASCYTANKSMARNLLTRRLPTWGLATLFSLAETKNLMDFMGQSCCQTKLNEIWYGDLNDYMADWKIHMVMLCPPLVPLCTFKCVNHDKHLPDNRPKTSIIHKIAEEGEDDYRSEHGSRVKANRGGKGSLKLRHVTLFGLREAEYTSEETVSYTRAIYLFYAAPVTKFYVNTLWYILFLLLFSYVVLDRIRPMKELYNYDVHVIAEVTVWIWTLSIFVKEINELLNRDAISLWAKLRNHLASFWNKYDFCINVLMIVAVLLRLQPNKLNGAYVNLIYAICLLLQFLRAMQLFHVSKQMGPKVIMIHKMMKDLMFFICILAMFIVSFGVAMQAIIYPNQPFALHVIVDAVYTPYWQIFGELILDRVEGKQGAESCAAKNATNEMLPEFEACPEQTIVAPILFAVYMMMSNVLLLNLLIAMFSYSFQLVQEQSEKIWRYHRYYIVHDFAATPPLPPPFVIFAIAFRFMRSCCRRMCKISKPESTALKKTLSKDDNLRLSTFVQQSKDRYLTQQRRTNGDQMDIHVRNIEEKVQKMTVDLDDLIQDGKNPSKSGRHSRRRSSPPGGGFDNGALNRKVQKLEGTINEQKEMLQELLRAVGKLSSRGRSSSSSKK